MRSPTTTSPVAMPMRTWSFHAGPRVDARDCGAIRPGACARVGDAVVTDVEAITIGLSRNYRLGPIFVSLDASNQLAAKANPGLVTQPRCEAAFLLLLVNAVDLFGGYAFNIALSRRIFDVAPAGPS